MKPVRLLPLVAFAALCLFVLKLAGLLFSGGYMLSGAAPASAQDSNTADAAQKPPTAAETDGKKEERGSAAPENAAEKDAAKKDAAEKNAGAAADTAAAKMGAEAPAGPAAGPQAALSSSELAVLQSLSKRRKALEKRARELQLRENLLKAAEQRVEKRISQLKTIESRIEKTHKQQDKDRNKQLAGLVTMYSGMKPKNAAKIFNRLDIEVLKALAKRIKPRAMSEILAAMETKAAQRLTLEIANESDAKGGPNSALPKIQSPAPR